MTLFHITSQSSWADAKREGVYRAPSLESEGFIHLSHGPQLLPSANRHFAGQSALTVLELDPERLSAEVRLEEAHGQSFPHLYGSLNLDAVIHAEELPQGDDGRFALPVAWLHRAADFTP